MCFCRKCAHTHWHLTLYSSHHFSLFLIFFSFIVATYRATLAFSSMALYSSHSVMLNKCVRWSFIEWNWIGIASAQTIRITNKRLFEFYSMWWRYLFSCQIWIEGTNKYCVFNAMMQKIFNENNIIYLLCVEKMRQKQAQLTTNPTRFNTLKCALW